MENRNRKTIFISNLPITVTEEDLKNIFENFGPCVSCELNMETQSAYFEFETEISAEKALDLNTVDMGGKPVKIVIAYQEEIVVDEQTSEEVDYTKAVQIFVGDIGFDVDEIILKDGFSQFGKILDTKVVRMPDGKHRGFAFLTFSNETEAENAIQSMNNTMFHNRNIKCNWATKNKNVNGNGSNRKSFNQQQMMKTLEEISYETPHTNSSVYVTGENLLEENLRPCFERFGKIKNIKAYPEKNHAFINYDNHEAAAYAIFQLNSYNNTTSFKCNWSKKNIGSSVVSDKHMLDNFYSNNQQYYDNSNQYYNNTNQMQQYEQFYQANYQASQYQQQFFNNPQVFDYYNNVQMQKFPQYQNSFNARPQKPMNHQTYPYYAPYNNNNSQQFNMYQ